MADQPQPSPGYVGMLGLTCACMLVGIVAMALEATEYDWEPKPKATQAIALPKVVAAIEPEAPAAVAEAKPEAKPAEVAKVEPSKPAPAVVLPPIVPPAATAKVEPKPAPSGPVPSPLTLPLKSGNPKPSDAPKDEPKPEAPKSNGPTPSPLRIGR